MDHNIAYLITTYNRQSSLRNLVAKLSGDIYIVDDGSTPPVDVRANVHYQENKGKRGYYQTVTQLWNMVRGKHYDYYIMLPDDFMPVENYLNMALKMWINIHDPKKICLNLFTEKSRYMKPCWTNFTTVEYDCYLHTQWVDMCFLCESEFFECLNYKVEKSLRDWDKYPELGSGVGSWISRTLDRQGYTMYQVKNSLFTVQPDGYISKMNNGASDSLIYQTI